MRGGRVEEYYYERIYIWLSELRQGEGTPSPAQAMVETTAATQRPQQPLPLAEGEVAHNGKEVEGGLKVR